MNAERIGPERKTVADQIAEIIEGVLASMRELIGPLTEEEENHLRVCLADEVTRTLISRLELTNFMGHGVQENE